MSKASLNSKRVMDAMANPTPENKYLRDQYQWTYPMTNRERANAARMNDNLLKIYSGSILVHHRDHYTGVHMPLSFYCKTCGHSWLSTPATLIYNKTGCPACREHRPSEKPKRLTVEEQQKVLQMASAGHSIKEIQEATGRSYRAVRSLLDSSYRDQNRAESSQRYWASKKSL